MEVLLMTKAGATPPSHLNTLLSENGAHHFPFAPSHLYSGEFKTPGFFETYLTVKCSCN